VPADRAIDFHQLNSSSKKEFWRFSCYFATYSGCRLPYATVQSP
jgi:hypothetical protein